MVGSLHEVRPGRWLYVEVLYANEHGQFAAQKQIALLVHGSMAHNSQYDEQCKALVEAGLSVVRYDLLGCGASLKPRAASMAERLAVYSPAEAYKDLVGILEQFTEYKGWSSVLLIGHSYGAPLVCELAVLHPKRIAGVVCLGFGYPRPGTEPPSKFNAWYLKCPEWVLQLLMPYLATARVRKLYYKGTLQSKPKLIRDEWWAWARNAPWVVQALMVQIPDQTTPWSSFRALVQSISAPALILDMESSRPPGQTAPELMAADMQDAEGFAVPQSGHQVHQDQPEAVNQLILHFLQTRVFHTAPLQAVKPF